MQDGSETDDRWTNPGLWGWLHALDVLDPAPDPTVSGILRLATRSAGADVELWLRDGTAWHHVGDGDGEPVTGDPTAATTHVDVVLGGLAVGELRTAAPNSDVLGHAAVEIAARLEQRWTRARRDEQGRPIGVMLLDDDLHIAWLSPEFDEIFGFPREHMIDFPIVDILASGDSSHSLAMVEHARHSPGRSAYIPIPTESAEGIKNVWEVAPDNRLHDPHVGALCLIVRYEHETDDEHTVLGDQIWVLNQLTARRPLDVVLRRVIELVERRDLDGHVCLMRMDEDAGVLRPLLAPGLPDEVVEALAAVTPGPDAPGGGSAMFYEMPKYTSDIAVDDAWRDVRTTLTNHGYHSCWSSPLRSLTDDHALGSLDLYRRSTGLPSERSTRVLLMGAQLAGLAIDQDAHERDLRYRATHDPLTDLPNRASFGERLEAAAGDGKLGVLFVDLDRFKLVNDTAGHGFGDELLQAVSRRLAAAVAEPAVVARFGGDEFTVLLPKAETAEDVVREGQRLLSIISEPYRIREQTVTIGASAGATYSERPPEDTQSLVRDADSALYHAKDRGRGRLELFDDRLLAIAADRVRVEQFLRDALDAGLLDVEFQPAVRIADGVAVSAEALARCRTAMGETVPPATFIPVAEEVGLIDQVFEAVLAEACRAAKLWNQNRSEPFVVWVNLSAQQLGSRELFRQIRRAIDASRADPATLGFEVTERSILPDPDEAAKRLDELARLGARLAVDDFGTGYSSLGYLQDLPVDTVKLDRSFIIRAGEDKRSRAIVGAVVDLADAMDLTCVAEGVETSSQLDIVEELGCKLVQGFVYARPKRVADLTTWLASHGG